MPRRSVLALVAAVAIAWPAAGCTTTPEHASAPTGHGDAIVERPTPTATEARPMPTNQVAIDGRQAASSAAAARAAAAFMRAFARPDLPEQAWWARVAPLLTPAGRHAALGTDPALIPVTTVTGKPEVLPGAEPDARTVRVPTDNGPYSLFMLRDGYSGRWLVETYQAPDTHRDEG